MKKMSASYDKITAQHYASYRPSLHIPILQKCLEDKEENLGLDIGCGTGQSAIALTQYCSKVIGVDTSAAMLTQAITHPNITYKRNNGSILAFADATFDIVSLAGVLHYAKSQAFLDEITRVAKKNASIVVYDFEIQLAPVFKQLKIENSGEEETGYNHDANFSGLEQELVVLKICKKEKISMSISSKNLAHLLLSSTENYKLVGNALGFSDVYDTLQQHLASLFKKEEAILTAIIFYSVYQVI